MLNSMDSNGGTANLPEREITSLEFHLALLNKAHETVPDTEILEYCMWLIPFITTKGHLWWSIYPSDNGGIELCSGDDEELFIFEFHKKDGFVKLTGKIMQESTTETSLQNLVESDFIDMDKVPQEYKGVADLLEKHRSMSTRVFTKDPQWKTRMVQQDIPFFLG